MRKSVVDDLLRWLRHHIPCAECGAHPVEWHHPGHPEGRGAVSRRRNLDALFRELGQCVPLCRRCHHHADGTNERLLAVRYVADPTPKPCVQCGKPEKPLRRGLCNACACRARKAKRLAQAETVA